MDYGKTDLRAYFPQGERFQFGVFGFWGAQACVGGFHTICLVFVGVLLVSAPGGTIQTEIAVSGIGFGHLRGAPSLIMQV